MALYSGVYSSVIDALSPVHAFGLDGNATDRAGALGSTATGVTYTGAPLGRDVTVSMLTSGTTNNLELAASTTVTNVSQTR